MNANLQDLAYKASMDTGVDGIGGPRLEVDLEEFARLIVLECERVSKNPKWWSESPSDGWRSPINHVTMTFKEHFGVK
jgi:hypothetical protein